MEQKKSCLTLSPELASSERMTCSCRRWWLKTDGRAALKTRSDERKTREGE
jgi:hypothetical protein